MREVILALDAGGTSIKAGILRGEEIIAERSFAFLSEEREQMLSVFRQALAWGRDYGPICLGVACPGPFDFARGVSHMRHKWRGLMDVPLPSVFARELPGVPVRFLHDSTAFLLGEAWQGAARDMENPAGVMLGTGFGFTVMQRRRVLVDANGTPALVLWNAPFRDGTVEDYVSRRALRDAYGPQAPDVRELAELARGGDTRAQAIFRRMGEALGEVLTRYLPAGTDGVVLGGQIARSAELFLPWAQILASVTVARHIGSAALRGAAVFCRGEAHEFTKEA